MTPPRPTAPTAAELREATIQMHCDSGGCDSVRGGPPGSHDSVGCHLAGMLDDLMAAVRAEALASERERCALELDELAQEADMAAYACLGGATADTEPGEVLDGEGLSIAAATACAYRDGAARIRAMVHR